MSLIVSGLHMPGKIFINYRRDDSASHAGRLFDWLQKVFQLEQLFMDVTHIEPGLQFDRVLEEQVGQCDVLLAVIGKGWIDARDDSGVRCLDNHEDFVRVEIEWALRLDKRVIPVLVDDTRMPRPEKLPETIRPLAKRNAMRLSHDRFGTDVLSLIETLQRVLQEADAARQQAATEQKGKAEWAAGGERSKAEHTQRAWQAELLKRGRWSFTIRFYTAEEDHKLEYVPGVLYGQLERDGVVLKRFFDQGRHTHTFEITPHISRFGVSYNFATLGIRDLQFWVGNSIILSTH